MLIKYCKRLLLILTYPLLKPLSMFSVCFTNKYVNWRLFLITNDRQNVVQCTELYNTKCTMIENKIIIPYVYTEVNYSKLTEQRRRQERLQMQYWHIGRTQLYGLWDSDHITCYFSGSICDIVVMTQLLRPAEKWDTWTPKWIIHGNMPRLHVK